MFHFKGSPYLLAVDYFSQFIEVAKLESTTSGSTIVHMKYWHAMAYPSISCWTMDLIILVYVFSKEYQFKHETSSPMYPQGIAEAERAVQTIKRLLIGAKEPYIAVITQSNTTQ